MTHPSAINEEDRAELIAYLDGELDEAAAQRIEARLNQDPTMRAEVESLQRTWEMLDYLPRTEASPHFTHRTLERLTAQQVATTHAQRLRRRLGLGLGWVAAALVALAGGYASMKLFVPREPTDEELARDLRVLENRRLYEQVESIDFLRELDHADLFGDDNL